MAVVAVIAFFTEAAPPSATVDATFLADAVRNALLAFGVGCLAGALN